MHCRNNTFLKTVKCQEIFNFTKKMCFSAIVHLQKAPFIANSGNVPAFQSRPYRPSRSQIIQMKR